MLKQNWGLPDLPMMWDDENNKPVDLGACLGLRVGKGSTEKGTRIYPSFISWCVQHTHVLKWKLTVEILASGQTSKFEGQQGVTVLGEHGSPIVGEQSS